jgi:hypothetical protein
MSDYWKVKKEPGIWKDFHWEDPLESKRIQYLLSLDDEDISPLYYDISSSSLILNNNDHFWLTLNQSAYST